MKEGIQFAAFLGVLFLWMHMFGSAGIVGFIVSAVIGFAMGGWISGIMEGWVNRHLDDESWYKKDK